MATLESPLSEIIQTTAVWGLSQFASDEINYVGKFQEGKPLPAYRQLRLTTDQNGVVWEVLPEGMSKPKESIPYADFQAKYAVMEFPQDDFGRFAATNYMKKHAMERDFVVFAEIDREQGVFQEWLVRKTSIEEGKYPPEGIELYLKKRFGATMHISIHADGQPHIEIQTHSDTFEQAMQRKKYLLGFRNDQDSHLQVLGAALGLTTKRQLFNIAITDSCTRHFDETHGSVQLLTENLTAELPKVQELNTHWFYIHRDANKEAWVMRKNGSPEEQEKIGAQYLLYRFQAKVRVVDGKVSIRCPIGKAGSIIGEKGWHIDILKKKFFGGKKITVIEDDNAQGK